MLFCKCCVLLFALFCAQTGDQARYQEYGQEPGSTTQAQAQAQAAAWQSSAPSAYVSATRTRARIKHSVNLSMDSLYQALNSADEDYHDSDIDPYSSTAGSAWGDHDHDHVYEHEHEHAESDTNNSPLIPVPPAAPAIVRRVGSNPALSTYSSSGNYGSSASSTHRPTSPQTLPPGRLTRNHYVGQSTLLSPTLASASGYQQQQQQRHQLQQQQQQQQQHQQHQQHQYPSRLGIPRTRTSDSDLSGTASTTSTASSGRSSGLSPITPETPPLPTPVDPFGTAQASFFSKHAGGGVMAASAPLTSIEEASLYDDDTVSGTRSHTPNGNSLDVVHRAAAAAAAPPDTAAWKERLRGAGGAGALPSAGAGYGNPLPPSPLSPEPMSPAFSVFSDTTSNLKSPDAVSETRHTSFTRSLFSRQPHKLRASKSVASAESSKKQPAPSLLSTSTASSEDPSMWSDARDVKKASKAEEKRRKKDEERRRIEQLALQLKASAPGAPRPGPKDGHSTLSGSSEERRRQANKWLEETDGLYGGAINTWGGL